MAESQGQEANAAQVHTLHLSNMTESSHPFLATSLKLSVALSKADSILLICSSSSLSLSIQLQTGNHNPVSPNAVGQIPATLCHTEVSCPNTNEPPSKVRWLDKQVQNNKQVMYCCTSALQSAALPATTYCQVPCSV